jgi:hypothetical protein
MGMYRDLYILILPQPKRPTIGRVPRIASDMALAIYY